jgi:hypothetical protein
MPQAPNIAPGCHCTDPVTCEFFDHCNPPRPEDHIGFLPRLQASAVQELEEMGIGSIRDIPDDLELTEIQRCAVTCVQKGEPWFDPQLRNMWGGLVYPLFFADFETVNWAVPPFAGMRPYDHLPFQWSVHVLREPGAEPEHLEFLATDANDPRREFISALFATLGETGSIVVYSSFESRGYRSLQRGCRNLQSGSGRSKPDCSICCPLCENTLIIRHTQARTRSNRCCPLSCRR